MIGSTLYLYQLSLPLVYQCNDHYILSTFPYVHVYMLYIHVYGRFCRFFLPLSDRSTSTVDYEYYSSSGDIILCAAMPKSSGRQG